MAREHEQGGLTAPYRPRGPHPGTSNPPEMGRVVDHFCPGEEVLVDCRSPRQCLCPSFALS